MCADGVKPTAQRYMYPNALNGLVQIGKDEGIGAFTKGLGPNVVRSILMSEYWEFSFHKRAKLTVPRCFSDCCVGEIRCQWVSSADIYRYTTAKRQLLSNEIIGLSDGVPVHILSSLAAGTVATTVCAPADVLKSRLQSVASAKGHAPVCLSHSQNITVLTQI